MEIELTGKEAQTIRDDQARIYAQDAKAGRLIREAMGAINEASAREAALNTFIAQKVRVEGLDPALIEEVDLDRKVIKIKETHDGTDSDH
jgi:hypothetical protein